MSHYRTMNIGLAVAFAIVTPGCAWNDERLDGLRELASLYVPLDHLPPKPEVDRPLFADLQEIRQLLRDRRFARALEVSNAQIATSRESESLAGPLPHFLVLRGIARYELHNPEAALADYNEAIALDSKYWPAYFHRWQCHLELGNDSAAHADRYAGSKLAPIEFDRDYDPHPWRDHGGMI